MASVGLCSVPPWNTASRACCCGSSFNFQKYRSTCGAVRSYSKDCVLSRSLFGSCQRPLCRARRKEAGPGASDEENPNNIGPIGTLATDAVLNASADRSSSQDAPESSRHDFNGVPERSLAFGDAKKASLVKAGKYYYEDAELLSRCTSVAERSAIALATMAYERARRLFNLVSANLSDLEGTFKKRVQGFSSSATSDSEAEEQDNLEASSGQFDLDFKRLSVQVACLEQELTEKDRQLQLALAEVRRSDQQLRALQESVPSLLHDADVVIDMPHGTWRVVDDAERKSQEDLVFVEEKVAGLLGKVQHLNRLIAGWKNAFVVLQKESQHSSEALRISAQELKNAQSFIESLRSLADQQASEVGSKSAQISGLEGELDVTKKKLEEALRSLSSVEQQRITVEESFKHEKESLTRTAASHKDALAVAEKKLVGLSSEIASLKSAVDGKDELIRSMRDDARRNGNMLVSAAKTREALMIAEKRIEQLNTQVNALEDEVKSRDLVLNDIKEEAVQSTEALRLAAEIKKDLNLSKQRELELSQELERMKDIVKDLREEVVENNRAVRAEQALRQLESEMDEVINEVEILRKGIEARDEAIQLMKEEVDRNIDVLSHAAGNRELVRDMEEHIAELKAEVRKKDMMLAAMGKNLEANNNSTGSTSRASSSNSNSSNSRADLYDETPSYDLPSTPSTSPSQPYSSPSEASKARKRVTRNTTGFRRPPRQNP